VLQYFKHSKLSPTGEQYQLFRFWTDQRHASWDVPESIPVCTEAAVLTRNLKARGRFARGPFEKSGESAAVLLVMLFLKFSLFRS
jgi:hypothetical protein